MQLVNQMGSIYQVTNRRYKDLLAAIACGNDINMSNYGKYLGTVVNITDMTQCEAAERLENINRFEGN